jgi:hypothetical protein
MTREEMMNNAIRKYGFEHPWVIQFCKHCEDWEQNEWNDKCLESLYLAMIHYQVEEEE